MPKGLPPTVFVSSTCYDLNQLRVDLRGFFEELGLAPLVSESPGFPVSPDLGPIDNCVSAVKDRAGIFILIVGARYGSLSPSGKSITNLEYLAAKAKGIPIYVFVMKSIASNLSVWRDNKDGNFQHVVDTPKLFEFLDSLHEKKEHWLFPFENAQQIMEILRQQLAHLFMDSLLIRESFKRLKLPPALMNLTGEPLSLLMERPRAWEFSLFASVLESEIEAGKPLKWDIAHGLQLGTSVRIVSGLELCQWLPQKFTDIMRLVDSAGKLMNHAIQQALGPQGVAANAEHVVYVARRLGEVYRSVLKWTVDFNEVELPSELQTLISLAAS